MRARAGLLDVRADPVLPRLDRGQVSSEEGAAAQPLPLSRRREGVGWQGEAPRRQPPGRAAAPEGQGRRPQRERPGKTTRTHSDWRKQEPNGRATSSSIHSMFQFHFVFFLSENANRLEIHFLSSQARVTWRKGLPRFRWNFLPRLRHGGQLRSSCVSSGGRTCWAAPVEAPPGAPTPQGIEAGPPLDTQTNKHAVGLVCDRALLICVWVYALGIVTWQINDDPASLFEVQQFASSVFAFAATEQLRNDLANHRHCNLQDKNTNTLEWNHSP